MLFTQLILFKKIKLCKFCFAQGYASAFIYLLPARALWPLRAFPLIALPLIVRPLIAPFALQKKNCQLKYSTTKKKKRNEHQIQQQNLARKRR